MFLAPGVSGSAPRTAPAWNPDSQPGRAGHGLRRRGAVRLYDRRTTVRHSYGRGAVAMNHPYTQGEVRPSDAVGSPPAVDVSVPLLRLRGYRREPVLPEDCLLGPSCLVCRWRRAGLLEVRLFDPPTDARDRAEAA